MTEGIFFFIFLFLNDFVGCVYGVCLIGICEYRGLQLLWFLMFTLYILFFIFSLGVSLCSTASMRVVTPDSTELAVPSLPRVLERKLYAESKSRKSHYVIGVDEAGRGPLCGPVVAAAFSVVTTRKDMPTALATGVTDSKQVREEARETMYTTRFKGNADIMYEWSVVDNKVIDKVNILQATFLAMSDSATRLMARIRATDPSATFSIVIDGNKIPPQIQALSPEVFSQCVIKGDSIEFVIAAASIVAKVERDAIMYSMHAEFPQYGLNQHKGYPTGSHVAAVKTHGPCKYHRMTFAPLKYMKGGNTKPSTKRTAPAIESLETSPGTPSEVGIDLREERLRRRIQLKERAAVV